MSTLPPANDRILPSHTTHIRYADGTSEIIHDECWLETGVMNRDWGNCLPVDPFAFDKDYEIRFSDASLGTG